MYAVKKNLTSRFAVQYTDGRAEQSRAEQSRAEQSRAEQSRAEQSRAEQVKLCPFVLFKKDIKTLLGHG